MAWIDPRTWFDGQVVTSTDLNDMRDAFDFLGRLHDHSGDAGDGDSGAVIGHTIFSAQIFDGHRTDSR